MKKILFLTSLSLLMFAKATASPICNFNCPGTFSVGADWLYWKGDESGLIYGAEVDVETPTVDTIDITSHALQPNFQYMSGFRINVDYLTQKKDWTFSGSYTHMPLRGVNDLNLEGMTSFDFATLFNVNFPLLSILEGALFSDLNAHWSADINYFDLTASRNFEVCQWLDVSPFIGIRGFWMCQTFALDGIGSSDIIAADVEFDSAMRSNFGVGGLEGGITSSLKLGYGFSIDALFGGSLLYGPSNDKGNLVVAIDDAENFLEFHTSKNITIASVDAFIGLTYAACAMCVDFDIHAGWEHHVIYGTNNFSFNGAGNYTTLQGLTLGANVRF